MVGHKTSLRKFKKIEIILAIFSNYNGIKLKINKRKAVNQLYVEINTLLNNQWVKEE